MTVDSIEFRNAMMHRWCNEFGNAYTEELGDAWQIMANSLNAHVCGVSKKSITALPLPTGTGKTQGLCLYCSMLCKTKKHGVLIVTSFIDEANKIAETINKLGNQRIAIAEHSKNKNAAEDITNTPVLIITHSAYQRAVDGEFKKGTWHSKWSKFLNWKGGKRNLTVIDEAINIVNQYEITLEQMRLLLSLIPSEAKSEYKNGLSVLEKVFDHLDGIVTGRRNVESYQLFNFVKEKSIDLNFSELERDTCEHIRTYLNYDTFGVSLHTELIKFVRHALQQLEEIVSSWSIYSKSGRYHSFSTARFILPNELKSFVLLDATASANPVSRALGEYVQSVDLPNVKSYQELSLHISEGHNVGRTSLEKIEKDAWVDIVEQLNSNEFRGKIHPLICVHKAIEDKLSKLIPDNWSVMHWGAINGRNDWSGCDAIVFIGLPFLSSDVCARSLMAFLDWEHQVSGKTYLPNILQLDPSYISTTYPQRHIIVSLVQAINRAHCRKMTKGGNCPPTDVYLYTSARLKKAIEHHLGKLLPQISIRRWGDAPSLIDKPEKLTKTQQKIIDALNAYSGEKYEVVDLLSDTGISKNTFNNNYVNSLSNKKGKFYEALGGIGWVYLNAREASESVGKYRQHFIKKTV